MTQIIVKWADFCHSLYAAGQMKDFSKAECFRVREILLSNGRVEQVGRGRYALKITEDITETP
jgi:hypothetical protein